MDCHKSYVGETSRSFNLRHSGLTQHREKCDGDINGPHILCTVNQKCKKNNMKHSLRVTEALFIRRYDCGPFKGMNEDNGYYVKTTQFDPAFAEMMGRRGQVKIQGSLSL